MKYSGDIPESGSFRAINWIQIIALLVMFALLGIAIVAFLNRLIEIEALMLYFLFMLILSIPTLIHRLSYDHIGITYSAIFSTKKIAWSEIRSVSTNLFSRGVQFQRDFIISNNNPANDGLTFNATYFRFRDLNFWVHSWVENYVEVEISNSFHSTQELSDVAYDVGIQLGKGHVKQIASPLDLQLRLEQLRILNEHETQIRQIRNDLFELTLLAWEEFRKALEQN